MSHTKILTSPNPPPTEAGALLFETERLIVRRIHLDDLPAFATAANHPDVVGKLSDRWPYPYTLEEAKKSYDRWEEASRGETGHYLRSMVVLIKPATPDDTPQLIGSMGLAGPGDVEWRTWILGYWFSQSSWGKGYATEAVGAFTRYAFERFPDLNRIQAQMLEWNTGSANVAKKCGFQLEGRRRMALEKNGVVADDLVWGLIRSDLEGLK